MAPDRDVQRFFDVRLRDLGEITPGMEGILIPETEVGAVPVGVTGQFLEDADSYHERFTDLDRFQALISSALGRLEVPEGELWVLDLGSGSGNSVLPCLDLLPDCRVVAIDISPDLLRILRDHVDAEPGTRGRVAPVCMSATSNLFTPGGFQLSVGAAILHHLIDPGAAIEAVGGALEQGASALFFEPLEGGHGMLRLAYTQILEEREARRSRSWRKPRDEREQEAAAFAVLRSMVAEFELRTGRDKSSPIYREIDDKWLFTRADFEGFADRGGFSQVRIDPLSDHPDPYTRHTRAILRLAKGLEPEALPQWAWDRIAGYEAAFSEQQKRDLLIEGCITLTK